MSVGQSGDVGRSENLRLGLGGNFIVMQAPFEGEFLGCVSAAQPHSSMFFHHCCCRLVLLSIGFRAKEAIKAMVNYCAAYGAERFFSLVFLLFLQNGKVIYALKNIPVPTAQQSPSQSALTILVLKTWVGL